MRKKKKKKKECIAQIMRNSTYTILTLSEVSGTKLIAWKGMPWMNFTANNSY